MENKSVPQSFGSVANRAYEIISIVAYLIGVQKVHFERDHEPPLQSVYDRLKQHPSARVMRSLCEIRSTMLKEYQRIDRLMQYELKNLDTLPDLFPAETLCALEENGIRLIKPNYRINRYIVDVNLLISQRVNNCRDLFPLWIKWDYIKDIFVMPNGAKLTQLKPEWAKYTANINLYPYQCYINWPLSDNGNILLHDRKFVTLLYANHGEAFDDHGKVSDAGGITKDNVYGFLDANESVAIMVDCENCDPFKLYATLRNLNETELSRIKKIILYDDIHTSSVWRIFDRFTSIPVEREDVARITNRKSLVDIRMTAGTCREYYQDRISAFIIASSDSDYWGLISALPNASFLVMVERDKLGVDMRAALKNAGIFYCCIDDFCTGNIDEIKTGALLAEIEPELDNAINLNVNEMLDAAIGKTRIGMTDGERRQFFEKYIKTLRLVIDADGEAHIAWQKK
jgi:hypothetical protein